MSSPFHEGPDYAQKTTRYNVYIVRSAGDTAVSLVGKELTGDKADKRSETCMGKINVEKFFPISEKVGNAKDAKYAADVAAEKAAGKKKPDSE